ncbi:MAG TPA: PsiF family protein [Steroidobacteraceae bacterium]|nr:PsiF family protein [Steroidobacteraceae bacterium]
MKTLSAFVAVALLGSGAVLAADAAAPAATPAAAPAAAPAKHVSLKACNRQAAAKSLKGADREKFVKDCQAGKSAG